MELDLHTKQHLGSLLAKPSMVKPNDAAMLSNLIKAYPYYRPLHLLLAKAEAQSLKSNSTLTTAALYNGGALVHQVLHHPERFATSSLALPATVPAQEIENVLTDTAEHTKPLSDEQETFEEINEVNTPALEVDEEEIFDEIAEVNVFNAAEPQQEEEEIFEEIAEIDPKSYVAAKEEMANTEPQDDTLPDELAIESIVAADFFAFEKSFTTEPSEAPKVETKIVNQPEEYDQEAEDQTVSKYDDDKLPYTFLWWLAKTRKEHEQIFQPYVTPKKSSDVPAVPGELQQQYVEHIFHLQTPFNVADEASKGPVNKQVAHKGAAIIDSFIKNEPQIRPPKAEQINNENKAKKSAEDHNDLVSETLAAIYIEQMLYHKAIDTYEKLSLKFPEKSRYFADLIQSLKKKI